MATERPARSTQRVSISEFKARLSRYLAQARSHAAIEITCHRKVVARVTGIAPEASEEIARLVATGAVSWSGGKRERRVDSSRQARQRPRGNGARRSRVIARTNDFRISSEPVNGSNLAREWLPERTLCGKWQQFISVRSGLLIL